MAKIGVSAKRQEHHALVHRVINRRKGYVVLFIFSRFFAGCKTVATAWGVGVPGKNWGVGWVAYGAAAQCVQVPASR
jgi:hypothetical protein